MVGTHEHAVCAKSYVLTCTDEVRKKPQTVKSGSRSEKDETMLFLTLYIHTLIVYEFFTVGKYKF